MKTSKYLINCILTRTGTSKIGSAKKATRYLGVYEPYCIHFRPDEVWTTRKHVELMVSDLKYAVHRPVLILSYGFYAAIVIYQIVLSKFNRTGSPSMISATRSKNPSSKRAEIRKDFSLQALFTVTVLSAFSKILQEIVREHKNATLLAISLLLCAF